MTTQALAVTQEQGSQRVDLLLSRLQSAKDFKVRIAAAHGLGKIADGTLAYWMLSAFRTEDKKPVRMAILYGIADIPDPRILAPLLHLIMNDPLSVDEQRLVEQILWSYRGSVHKDAWFHIYRTDNNPKHKGIALWLLGLVGAQEYRDAMHVACRSISPYLRQRAIEALAFIANPSDREKCSSAARDAQHPGLQISAKRCLARLDLATQEKNDSKWNHQVVVNTTAERFVTNNFTPDIYFSYANYLAQPSQLELASQLLGPAIATNRESRLVPLLQVEEILPTFKISASFLDKYESYTMDLELVRSIIRKHSKSIYNCYLQRIKHATLLSGVIVTEIIIQPSGRVDKVSFETDTFKDQQLNRCMMDTIKAITFPKFPDRTFTIQYGFQFLR